MKKVNLILLVLGCAFFAWLVWTTGPGELLRTLSSLGWGLLPFILGEGLAEMIHTFGWRRCLTGPHRSIPWFLLFRIRMAGYAINYLTPTAALGGEVTKAGLLASYRQGPGAVSGVLVEKVAFAVAQVLFVALGSVVVLPHFDLPRPLWTSMLFGGLLVAGGIVAFLFLQIRGHLSGLVRRLAVRRNGEPALKKLVAQLTGVDDALRAIYREQPRDLGFAVLWHLLGFSVGIFQSWFFFHLLAPGASLGAATAAWLLGMWFDLLTFTVPMNAGSLEGSRIIAFRALGYNSLVGLTYGVALRLAQLFWAGLGLTFFVWLSARRPHPCAPAESATGSGSLEPKPDAEFESRTRHDASRHTKKLAWKRERMLPT